MSTPRLPSNPKIDITSNYNRIYVSGLKTLCKEELTSEFAKYGVVQSVEIVNYDENNNSNNRNQKKRNRRREPFAFVTFESAFVAKQVVSKHNYSTTQTTPVVDDVTKNKTKPNNDIKNNNHHEKDQNQPLLYSIVEPANPFVPTYSKRVKKGLIEQEQILDLCQNKNKKGKPTLLLQVTSSHLNRVLQYIRDLSTTNNNHHSFPIPTIIGFSSPNAKNISFIYLHIIADTSSGRHTSSSSSSTAASILYWYNHFAFNSIFIRFGFRKVYAVDQTVKVPFSKQINDTERAKFLVDYAMDHVLLRDKNTATMDITFKVQTFPPKRFQHKVVEYLDRKIDNIIDMETKKKDLTTSSSHRHSYRTRNLSMSSTDYTHTFSCIQLFQNPQNQESTKSENQASLDEIFMIGIAPLSSSSISNDSMLSNLMDGKEEEKDKEICRAYFKLKEVMDNYRRDKEGNSMDFKGMDAFDCGSSPGGWTKYLLEVEKCHICYSCDPGELDESVLALKGTRNLQMRGIDAINVLQKEGKKVNLWVSDMCLFDPKQQVDHLILAKEKGILKNNAYFVLTLKFNTGHGKDTFDMFAKDELKRLHERIPVTNVETYHLFSNRKGERTIIGKLTCTE